MKFLKNTFWTLLIIFLISSLFIAKGQKFDTGNYYFIPMCLAGLMLFSATAYSDTYLKINNRQSGILFLLTLFLLFSGFAFLTSPMQSIGVMEVFMDACGLSLIFIILFTKRVNKEMLYKFLIGLMGLSFIIGVLFFIYKGHNRFVGLFFDPFIKSAAWPNSFALLSIMTLPILGYFAYTKNKWYHWLFLCLPLSGLLLSFSRGGMLVVILQAIFAGFIYTKQIHIRDLTKLVLIGTITIALSFGIYSARGALQTDNIEVAKRVTFENTTKRTSLDERKDFFKGAIVLSGKQPLLGYGPFSFRYVYPEVQPMFLANSDHPHNMFLKYSMERGIFTSFFLLTALALIFLYCGATITSNWTKALLIALGGGIAHNLIDYNLNFIINIVLFYGIIGLILKEMNDEEDPGEVSRGFALVNYIIVIFLMGFFIHETKVLYDSRSTSIPRAEILNDAIFQNYCPRDFQNSINPRACALSEAWRLYEQGESYKAVEIAKWYVKKNPYDAWGHLTLGQLYGFASEDELALGSLKTAIDKNPKNFWHFYKHYFAMAIKTKNADLVIEQEKTVVPLLEEYVGLAANNIHYTAETDNIDEAIETVGLMLSVDKENQSLIKVKEALELIAEDKKG